MILGEVDGWIVPVPDLRSIEERRIRCLMGVPCAAIWPAREDGMND